jgi:hypothetical protein
MALAHYVRDGRRGKLKFTVSQAAIEKEVLAKGKPKFRYAGAAYVLMILQRVKRHAPFHADGIRALSASPPSKRLTLCCAASVPSSKRHALFRQAFHFYQSTAVLFYPSITAVELRPRTFTNDPL